MEKKWAKWEEPATCIPITKIKIISAYDSCLQEAMNMQWAHLLEVNMQGALA